MVLSSSLPAAVCFMLTSFITPVPPHEEATAIAFAQRLVADHGQAIWPGLRDAPGGVVLITRDHEFAIGMRTRPEVFTPGRQTEGPHWRRRELPEHLLASFPAFNAEPVTLVGTMRTTAKTPAAWTAILVHERFHQWQMSHPDYGAAVDALDLKGDDATGMWMLNYPFPYTEEAVVTSLRELGRTLRKALADRGTARADASAAAYWTARAEVLAGLAPRDQRYFFFQTWQEGVARFVEGRSARVAARAAHADHWPRSLDAHAFTVAAEAWHAVLDGELRDLDSRTMGRVVFYPLGAGEALLLEADDPTWKQRYRPGVFDLATLR